MLSAQIRIVTAVTQIILFAHTVIQIIQCSIQPFVSFVTQLLLIVFPVALIVKVVTPVYKNKIMVYIMAHVMFHVSHLIANNVIIQLLNAVNVFKVISVFIQIVYLAQMLFHNAKHVLGEILHQCALYVLMDIL